jgi:hypothetical protein
MVAHRLVDRAHAARADLADDPVRTDRVRQSGSRRRGIVRERPEKARVHDVLRQRRALLGREQRAHLLDRLRVLVGARVEPGVSGLALELRGGGEQREHAIVERRVHHRSGSGPGPSASSARWSQARAKRQSSLTVSGLTPEQLGGLGRGQPAEELEFDDPCLPLVASLELGERVVEGDHVDRIGAGRRRRFERRRMLDARALLRPTRAGVVDEHAAHRPGGQREEARASVHREVGLDQARQSLVDERRRLQRVARTLLGETLRGDPPQLVVDERDQLRGGLRVTLEVGAQVLGGGLVREGHGRRKIACLGPSGEVRGRGRLDPGRPPVAARGGDPAMRSRARCRASARGSGGASRWRRRQRVGPRKSRPAAVLPSSGSRRSCAHAHSSVVPRLR